MELGQNIRTIRLIKNLTQEYIADRNGISSKWLGKTEKGNEKANDQL